MSNGKESHLGARADVCDVCETPIKEVDNPVTVEYMSTTLTFCSEKCYKEYLENPEAFELFEDDEELD